MPSIKEKQLKKGKGYVYKITCCTGTDPKTHKPTRSCETYYPKEGESRATAKKNAYSRGLFLESKYFDEHNLTGCTTFATYANKTIQYKRDQNIIKESTYERYQKLLERIIEAIGDKRLMDITQSDLKKFYIKLQKETVCDFQTTAIVKENVDILEIMKTDGIRQSDLIRNCDVSTATFRKIRGRKPILKDKADIIASELNMPGEAAFNYQPCDKRLSNKTMLEYHRLIKTILESAIDDGLIEKNIATKKIAPKARQKKPKPLEEDEVIAVLKAVEKEDIKWQALLYLAIDTGCRRGELLGLKWKYVNLKEHIINIQETLLALESGLHEDTPKTETSKRYIKIAQKTVEILQKYRDEQDQAKAVMADRWENKSDYVFTQKDGKRMHPDSFNGWMNKFCNKNGFRHINPHLFRHTMASILIAKKADIATVSRRLGHSSPSVTLNLYTEEIKKADAIAADEVESLINRVCEDEENK
ncbi:tyrosine-type recombinase/integrase [Oscillibacter sp.]|uniref:tyrosine-type recombinase/integrase n=1 Tax=Oscillibacter sp. TaxID=1945593 RepID=UPI00339A1818